MVERDGDTGVPSGATAPGAFAGVARTTLLSVVAVVGLAIAVMVLLREPALAFAKWFVATTGPVGVGAGFFVPDAAPLPVPHDLFLALGLLGGLSFGTIVVAATTGSILGGCLGFAIGRRLSHTPWFDRIMRGKGERARDLVSRHGVLAVGVCALTPLPYSLACWATGAFGMRFLPFLLVSQLRVVRVAGYLWLVERGVVQVMMP